MTLDGNSPYLYLFLKISKFFVLDGILLVGDFNACTGNAKYSIFDISSNLLCLKELAHDNLGVSCCSVDADTIITPYGKHLIYLGKSHDLNILNGIK